MAAQWLVRLFSSYELQKTFLQNQQNRIRIVRCTHGNTGRLHNICGSAAPRQRVCGTAPSGICRAAPSGDYRRGAGRLYLLPRLSGLLQQSPASICLLGRRRVGFAASTARGLGQRADRFTVSEDEFSRRASKSPYGDCPAVSEKLAAIRCESRPEGKSQWQPARRK
jgi:hypothetical protein